MTPPTCHKCGGPMLPGIATIAALTRGAGDFGPNDREVTLSPAPGDVRPCLKCRDCGRSVSYG